MIGDKKDINTNNIDVELNKFESYINDRNVML
jgi:hypothetical protein